jgi:hypothetical protein
MPKKSAPAPVGARFVVTKEALFKVGERVIANYLPPPFDYRVTDLNCGFVGDLLAAGTAVLTGAAGANTKAGGSAVTG